MALNTAQYDALKLIIEPFITTFIDAFNEPHEGYRDVRNAIHRALSGEIGCINKYLSPDLQTELHRFAKIYTGEQRIFDHHSLGTTPSQAAIREAMIKSCIEILHDYYPTQKDEFPILPEIDPRLSGMERIRALFKQYATLTKTNIPGGTIPSLERVLLAFQIVLEKEKLGLPSYFKSTQNIFCLPASVPGDFSHLDLSDLELVRSESNNLDYQQAAFKDWHLKDSKFDGSTFKNFCLTDVNFENASLRGTEFDRMIKLDQFVIINADIEGMYFGDNFIPDRRARNFERISRSREQLLQFRKNVLGMNPAQMASVADIPVAQATPAVLFDQPRKRKRRSELELLLENQASDRNNTEENPSKFRRTHPRTCIKK